MNHNGSSARDTIPDVIYNRENIYEGDLVHYFRAVFEYARNLSLPYHNFRHMLHVTRLCYGACKFYGMHELHPRERRNLLIAALFHDFDHTGRAGPDRINIAQAIRGFERHCFSADREYLPRVIDIIQATEWPRAKLARGYPLPELILRDADSAQGLDPAWIQQTIFGLAAEWGKSPLDLLKGQPEFIAGLRFQTSWAKHRFPQRLIDARVAEACELLALLGVKA
ncbi:MAG: hypothetical protein KGI79_00085 [Patescibacteria group bacterium]|nr:hypothetical protein [Patescibacteria group bacterium]MDE2116269.1 hypothetical protein [Patescibacteria group bacterium]